MMYMYILAVFIALICYCSSLYVDGTYFFTALAKEYNINICTNDKGESYMSINAINKDNLANANYVFAVFRDLDGIQEIECGVFVLLFEGFQMLPHRLGFEDMKYKFTVDTNSYQNKYLLSRDMQNEVFVLEKISKIPLTYCFEPGNYNDIQFPVVYKSIDLIGSGICPTMQESCYTINNYLDASLNACWAWVDDTDIAFTGGTLSSISFEWENNLSLGGGNILPIVEGGVCQEGTTLTVVDPKNPNKIIFSWQCKEGHLGAIYEFTAIPSQAECPLFTNLYYK